MTENQTTEPEFEAPMCEEIGCVLRLDHRPGHVDEDGNTWPTEEDSAAQPAPNPQGRLMTDQPMTTAAGVIQEAVRVVNWKPDAKHSERARYDALRALTSVYAFSTTVAMETLRRIDPAAAERVAQYLERVDDWAYHSENAWAWHERLTKGEPIDPKGYHFPALAGQTDDPSNKA